MGAPRTIQVLAVAYIGGRGSLWGGAVAAIPLVFLMNWLHSTFSNLPGVDLIIYGLLLIVVMLYYPGGIAQLCRQAWAFVWRPRKRLAAPTAGNEVGGATIQPESEERSGTTNE